MQKGYGLVTSFSTETTGDITPETTDASLAHKRACYQGCYSSMEFVEVFEDCSNCVGKVSPTCLSKLYELNESFDQ